MTERLRGDALVAVVQAADFRRRDDTAGRGDWTGRGASGMRARQTTADLPVRGDGTIIGTSGQTSGQ